MRWQPYTEFLTGYSQTAWENLAPAEQEAVYKESRRELAAKRQTKPRKPGESKNKAKGKGQYVC